MADPVRGPDSGGFVMAAGDEVVAEGSPFEIPDWTDMAFVDDDLLEDVEVPEADCAVCTGGEEPFGAWFEVVGGRSGG